MNPPGEPALFNGVNQILLRSKNLCILDHANEKIPSIGHELLQRLYITYALPMVYEGGAKVIDGLYVLDNRLPFGYGSSDHISHSNSDIV